MLKLALFCIFCQDNPLSIPFVFRYSDFEFPAAGWQTCPEPVEGLASCPPKRKRRRMFLPIRYTLHAPCYPLSPILYPLYAKFTSGITFLPQSQQLLNGTNNPNLYQAQLLEKCTVPLNSPLCFTVFRKIVQIKIRLL